MGNIGEDAVDEEITAVIEDMLSEEFRASVPKPRDDTLSPSSTPTLTGFAGKKGSGKSHVANELSINISAIHTSFSAPIKSMLIAMGLSAEEVYGELKEWECALLGGQTPRHAMQTLGTEWGRQMIHDDLWARIGIKNALAKAESAKCPFVVFDDVRFPNEVKAIKDAGGKVIWVQRDSVYSEGDTHSSENSIGPEDCCMVFDNSKPYITAEDLSAILSRK